MAVVGELVYQGAEARLFRGSLFGKDVAIKERFSKKYRLAALDSSLTSQRLKQEVRTVSRLLKSGVPTPSIFFVDIENGRIFYEWINGITVKKYIEEICVTSDSKNELAVAIGKSIAQMHKIGVIHGDLTSSNMMIKTANQEGSESSVQDRLVLIDFGLSAGMGNAEDMAVDLYVMERAFISTHPNIQSTVDVIIASYKQYGEHDTTAVMSKLKEVRLRGRKRVMIG
eukprot:c11730_g1_i1.p1 GENE.c11730_g1_i1~~c11730_g1_i1.p1  ORF type:complete len:227 (+),score=84.50 c11730_g1_i1:52-732(+)